jgi:hypothetical protein
MKNQKTICSFLWRVASSHMIAYFIAGICALVIMNYRNEFSSESLSLLMRPVDSAWTAAGPLLQIIRGVIIGLVLLPFRTVLFEEKHGFWKLFLLILGLSYISTIGPTPGSFEGYIYTILPVKYHLLGIPETILYTTLFSALLIIQNKYEKKLFFVLSVIFCSLIGIMSLFGILQSLQKL